MPLYSFKEFTPNISKDCFIAPSADIIGKVSISSQANVWYQCVLRGDVNKIEIGEGTNIQDLCMLHVIEELPLIIGKGVSVGHKVTLHACTIEDNCLIGMDSVVLDGAVIQKNSVVAAGSVVPPGKTYPPGSMIMGSPAKAVRPLKPLELKQYGEHYKSYIGYSQEFKSDVKRLD